MTRATHQPLIDWNADGDFSDTSEDVTSRARKRSVVRLTRGLDSVRTGSPPMAGECSGLELGNTDRVLSPFNSGSSLFGAVKPGRRLEWRVDVASDTFTRADSSLTLGTSSSGHVWTALNGVWGIGTNRARLVSGWLSNLACAVIDPEFSDGTVQCSFPVLNDGNRLVCRATTANDVGVYIEVDSTSCQIKSIIGGSLSTIDTITGMTNANGDVWRLELFGASVKVFKNGILVASVTSTHNVTATKHGLGASNSGTMSTARWDDFSFTRPLWNGVVREFKQNVVAQSVDVSALGMISQIARTRGRGVHTILYQDKRVDELAGYLLDACGLTDTRYRVFDRCDTIVRWWWLGPNDDPLSKLFELVRSEDGLLFEDGLGRLVLKGKFSADVDDRRSTSQVTLHDVGPSSPNFSGPFDLAEGHPDVVNEVQFTHRRRELQAVETVWELGYTLNLAPGESIRLDATTSEPFANAVTPLIGGGTDYTLAAGTLTVAPSLLYTSGTKTVIQMTAGASGATLSLLSFRAQTAAIVEERTITQSVDTSASVDDYDPIVYQESVLAEVDAIVLEALANRIVTRRQEPRATIRTQIANVDATHLRWILGLEIGDRLKINEGHTGVDESDHEWFVTQLEHTIASGGHDHRLTLGLEKADAAVTLFRLGVSQLSGAHKLG